MKLRRIVAPTELLVVLILCCGCPTEHKERYILDGTPIDRDLYDNIQAAEGLYARARYQQALGLANELIHREPWATALWRLRGNCYRSLGQYDQAIADYTEAIRRGKGSLETTYIGRALAYEHLKQYPNAIDDFTNAIELNPRNAPARFERAWCHHVMGNNSEAIAGYTDVIRLQPGHAAAYINRGRVYLQQDDRARAREDFTKAIAIDAKNWKPYYYRAWSRMRDPDAKAALADAEQAEELGGDVEPVLMDVLRILAGKSSVDEKMYEDWLRRLKQRDKP